MQSKRKAALTQFCGAVALLGVSTMPAGAADLAFDYKVNQGLIGTTFATLSIQPSGANSTTFTLTTDLSGGQGNPGIVDLYFGCNGCGTPTFSSPASGVVVERGGTQSGYTFDYRVRLDPGATSADTPIVWTANASAGSFLEATSGAGPDSFALIQLTGGAERINGANVTSGFYVSAVPEPATYAMLMVGLGLVGFAYRRRSP